MDISFNKIFKTANECKKRYRVLLGSAGSGKSVNVALDYILKLSDPKNKGANLLVVRSAEVSHLNSTFAELNSAINNLGLSHLWTIRTNPLSMKCIITGNSIFFRGCNDLRAIERLKSVTVPSGKLCWIWCEEATELKQSDFDILDDRLRGILPDNLYYQITLSFNPINANHWIKSTLWDYKDDNIFTHKSTYLDNKFVDEQYKIRMERRRELDPEGFRVYGLGDWGSTEGNVFYNFEVGSYQEKSFDSLAIGCDFGFSHNTAITLLAFKDDDVYVLKEVVANQKTTREIIEKCLQEKMPQDVIMYCDSAEPDRILELKKAGFKAVPVRKEKNSISNQLTWLKNRKIFIDGRCLNMHREIQQYRYVKDIKTGQFTDVPINFEDDSIASLRYGVEHWRKAKKLKTMKKGAFSL